VTDQLLASDIHFPEFTPDTIQHLKDVRQKMLDNASEARQQEQAWMHRATQWDALIQKAESNAQSAALAWHKGEGPTPCPVCGGDMWWTQKSGFLHPMEGGNWEAAGEACKRAKGNFTAGPKVESEPES
jgi:hypothetical protein